MAIGRTNSGRTICLVIMVSLIFMVSLAYESDTILSGQSIRYNQNIISQRGIFELGFFPNSNGQVFYVGIWYKRIQFAALWYANKDTPISSSSIDGASLILTRQGDLQLQVNGRIIWNTNTTTTDPNSTKAILLDSGNLIVGSESSLNMWESFNYPTYGWLPGAKIGLDATTGNTNPIILTTWRTLQDFGPGNYSLGVDLNGSNELLIWNIKTNATTRIGASDFSDMNLESNLNVTFNVSRANGINYATYVTFNDSNPTAMILDPDGQLRLYIWNDKSALWQNVWTRPKVCDSYAPCGSDGICSMDQSPVCRCPQGFQPNYISSPALHDYFAGCARIDGSRCLKDKDEFVALQNIKRPANYEKLSIGSANCRSACADNCFCVAYSNTSGCYQWYGELLGLEQLYNTTNGETIFLRSSSKKGAKKPLRMSLAFSTTLLILVLGCLSYYLYRKKISKGAKDIGQDLLMFDLDMTNKRHISQVQRNSDLALPIFSLSSVSSATDDFSSSNKLGEGGFGSVYKGKLRNGQEVAVKRLSKHSSEGLDELINEAKMIAQLQHTNLVKLLGCCIQKEEKILLYEYMPNKSLDFFLFDKIKKKMLNWSRRMHIIEGIAQGLLYLHHYSRVRIIHRDLKASNILLDVDMYPKISDFGMARIFGRNELQANTNHIVGTFGYMPPEYALEGLFSIKTDVFSFGVLLLEILSGERNISSHHEDDLNLVGYAWKLWTNDAPLELIDPTLKTSCDLSSVLRYVHVGLLCVQEHPDDRPTISDIVAMIGNEMKVIEVQPKQPAYLGRRSALEENHEIDSINDLTCSIMQPR